MDSETINCALIKTTYFYVISKFKMNRARNLAAQKLNMIAMIDGNLQTIDIEKL